jgi:hypothetical protein
VEQRTDQHRPTQGNALSRWRTTLRQRAARRRPTRTW